MNASVFGIISIVCYIVCLAFIGLSIFLFFFLDIKNAYGIYTGKNFMKGVEEIRQNDKRVHFYSHPSSDDYQRTDQIISGIDKNIKGVAHPSKQLNGDNQKKLSPSTGTIADEQTTILNDDTIVLDNDTIVLQPTIDLEEEVGTIDIHFDVIEEIKIIHSNQIIKERGK